MGTSGLPLRPQPPESAEPDAGASRTDIEWRWIAACLLSGLLGPLLLLVPGALVSLEALGAVVAAVTLVVLVPALVTAPRIASAAEDAGEVTAERPLPVLRFSATCALLTAGCGLLLDRITPGALPAGIVGVAAGLAILVGSGLLFGAYFRRRWTSRAVVVAMLIGAAGHVIGAGLAAFGAGTPVLP